MPNQTTLTGNVYFPDGAKVEFQENSVGSFVDLGAVNSAINMTLTYDENEVDTANAGKLALQIKNMGIDGSLTLINLNPANIAKLGGGIFETVVTAGTSVTSIDNQVIASGGAVNVTPYQLDIIETSANALKVSSALVIASVTGATDGVLSENDDFTIIDDESSYSGKSIVLNTAGATLTTMAQVITIVYTSVTPVARTTVYAGSSTEVLTAGVMRITHTDDAGLIRQLQVEAVDPTSGGFAFNFKGANEDGTEEMPLTFKGKPNTALTSGRQLISWVVDTGAA